MTWRLFEGIRLIKTCPPLPPTSLTLVQLSLWFEKKSHSARKLFPFLSPPQTLVLDWVRQPCRRQVVRPLGALHVMLLQPQVPTFRSRHLGSSRR